MTLPIAFKRLYLGLLCSLVVPLVFGLYSVKLGQDLNWDLQNYHLYNAYAYLNDRINIDLAPAGLQTYFNPYLDIAYFIAVSHFGPKTVGFLLGFIQGLNFILIYRISGHVLKEYKLSNIYSLLLALGGVLSVGFISEVGTTFNDSLVAIFPLLSLWMIISHIGSLSDDQRPAIVLILCSGVLAGIGSGLKLVILIYALSLCLSFLVLPVRWNKRLKLSFLFGVSVLIGLMASNGYWMLKMWSLFGNPLFPQFNHIFQGDLTKFEPILDIRYVPKTIFDKIFYPALFTINPFRVSELKYEQVSWIFAYVAALALLASRVVNFFTRASDKRLLNPEAGFFLAFFCISYFLWLNIFGIYRYLITIELLIPLMLFVAINHFFKSRIARWSGILFIGAITAVNSHGVPDWGHSSWAGHIYRIVPNELSNAPEPAAVYLVGQPLAWIVPALDIKTPFIQLAPNMPVSEAYWRRAKSLVEGREGKSFLVFESDTPVQADQAKAGLANLGLTMNDNSCGHMVAYLAKKFEFKYCEVNDPASK